MNRTIPSEWYESSSSVMEDYRSSSGLSGLSKFHLADLEAFHHSHRSRSQYRRKSEYWYHPRKHWQEKRLHANYREKISKKFKSGYKSIPGRSWNRQDAEKALHVEMQHRKTKAHTLIFRFPDPEISISMIKSLHGKIDKVHLQAPLQPRHCFVKLTEDADVDQVMRDLQNVDFYNSGTIKVEKKYEKPEEVITPEMIDPFTLYVGNLPSNTTAEELRRRFLTPCRIDIGFSCRLNFTRYAFLKYQTVEESIRAFESNQDLLIGGRNLIVRFRRLKNDAINDEPKPECSIEKITEIEPEEKNEEDTKQKEPSVNLYSILGNFNFGEDDDQISEEDGKEVDDDDDDDDEDDEDDN